MDALQVRFDTSDMLEGKYKSMWHYGRHKLQQIGMRGVFAGWSLSFLKDSFGSAVFFSTFEYMKAQSYYAFVTRYYASLHPDRVQKMTPTGPPGDRGVPVIKPHYALEPCFLMGAGIAASIAQQVIQHPLGVVQELHYERLEALDYQAALNHTRREMLRHYYHAYRETFQDCRLEAAQAGGWRRWLYRGFLVNTIKQVPSTSAGLIIFELVRRKYSSTAEEVRIEEAGYDILLL